MKVTMFCIFAFIPLITDAISSKEDIKYQYQPYRTSRYRKQVSGPEIKICTNMKLKFPDEMKPNIYYVCGFSSVIKKWVMYTFTCPMNSIFISATQKCSRTSENQGSYKEYIEKIKNQYTTKPISTINNFKSTIRRPTTEKPTLRPVAAPTVKAFVIQPPRIEVKTVTRPVKTTTPQTTATTTTIIISTKPTIPTSTSAFLEESNESENLFMKDFFITTATIPLALTDDFISTVEPEFSSSPAHGTLPHLRYKDRVQVKTPIPNNTQGFSFRLLEKFRIKFLPHDQFFHNTRPKLSLTSQENHQNPISKAYNISPVTPAALLPKNETLTLGNPVNLPNHLLPQLSESVEKPLSVNFNFNYAKTPVSRRPRI